MPPPLKRGGQCESRPALVPPERSNFRNRGAFPLEVTRSRRSWIPWQRVFILSTYVAFSGDCPGVYSKGTVSRCPLRQCTVGRSRAWNNQAVRPRHDGGAVGSDSGISASWSVQARPIPVPRSEARPSNPARVERFILSCRSRCSDGSLNSVYPEQKRNHRVPGRGFRGCGLGLNSGRHIAT
jgi:hypothetical protein